MRDDVKPRIIEISKSNYNDYCSLNIVAFSYAVGGAMGEGGGLYIITEDGRVFHTNVIRTDMTIDEAILICPPLGDCRFGLFGAAQIPNGWDYHYMGFGNHLFVKDDISKDVNEMSIGLEGHELYQQWKYIVMQVLSKKPHDTVQLTLPRNLDF